MDPHIFVGEELTVKARILNLSIQVYLYLYFLPYNLQIFFFLFNILQIIISHANNNHVYKSYVTWQKYIVCK